MLTHADLSAWVEIQGGLDRAAEKTHAALLAAVDRALSHSLIAKEARR